MVAIQDIDLMDTLARKTNSFFSAIVWNFLGQIFPGILMLICIPIVILNLGNDRFGVLSLAWGLFGYLSLLDFGMSKALTHSISTKIGAGRDEDLGVDVSTSTLVMFLLGSGLAILIYSLRGPIATHLFKGSSLDVEEMDSVLLWMAISLPFTLVSIGLKGVIEGFGRFDYANLVRVPLAISTYALPAVASYWSKHLGYGLMCLAISRFLAVILYSYFILRLKVKIKFGSFSKRALRELFSFGGWLAISGVLSPIMYQVDRFFVSAVVGTAAVTYYTAPLELATKLWFVPSAVLSVMFPAMASLKAANPAKASAIFDRSIRLTMLPIVGVIVIFLLFPVEILTRWISLEFALNSKVVFQIICFGILVNCLAQVVFTFIQAWGRPEIPAKFHLVQLPIFIAVFYYSVSYFGIVGAALAWTGRVALDALMLGIYAPKLESWAGTGKAGLFIVAIGALAFGLGETMPLSIRFVITGLFFLGGVAFVARANIFATERHELMGALRWLRSKVISS